jgi:REP element-mobilizing transposase RayT
MPFVKVWIHYVWPTKNREPYLTDTVRGKLIGQIRLNAKEKGIFLDGINGYVDHMHCLISLGTDPTIEKVIQLIKGESHWINKTGLCKTKFGWQDEYFAVSVSEASIESVRRYITNQAEHHRTHTFAEEFDGFMRRAGSQRLKDVK